MAVSSAVLLACAAAQPASAAPGKLAELPGARSVSYAQGTLAAAVGDVQKTLVVGPPSAPVAAQLGGPLPDWAVPHVGTDAAGRVVVTYPRCSGEGVGCDLYAYDVAAGAERRVAGAATSGEEVEGVLRRGRLLLARSVTVRGEVQRWLSIAAREGAPLRLVTRFGGTQLALRGRVIAQVRDTDPGSAICGQPSIEEVDTRTGRRELIDATSCGMDGAQVAAPAFVSGSLLWTWSAGDRTPYLYRLAATGARTRAKLPSGTIAFAPTALRAGYALHGSDEAQDLAPSISLRSRLGFGPAPSHGH